MASASCAVSPGPESKSLLDGVLKENAAQHGIPAQAVVILHKGAPLYRGFSGKARVDGGAVVTENTVFPVLSVSKLFASTLLLQLVEQGKVDLAAPAARYVENLPSAWRAITVGQFLSHVSGVPEYFDAADPSKPFPPSLQATFERLADQPLLDLPGTRTRYTQTNYLVIGAILEAVTGARYADLVRDRIIAPLALRNTWLGLEHAPRERVVAEYHGDNGRLVPDLPIRWPAYSGAHTGIHTTADDMAVFLAAVADGRFASRDALLRFWKPYPLANGDNGNFASGWGYDDTGEWREAGHDGGAKLRVRIVFRDQLDDHFVIVYLTNGSRDNVWSRTLVESVQRMTVSR